MIVSFADRALEDLYHGRPSGRARRIPPTLHAAVLDLLDVLAAVSSLQDLRSPPGLRLEALKGDLKGKHSIRVNDQWRLVFRWDGAVHDLALMDYHR